MGFPCVADSYGVTYAAAGGDVSFLADSRKKADANFVDGRRSLKASSIEDEARQAKDTPAEGHGYVPDENFPVASEGIGEHESQVQWIHSEEIGYITEEDVETTTTTTSDVGEGDVHETGEEHGEGVGYHPDDNVPGTETEEHHVEMTVHEEHREGIYEHPEEEAQTSQVAMETDVPGPRQGLESAMASEIAVEGTGSTLSAILEPGLGAEGTLAYLTEEEAVALAERSQVAEEAASGSEGTIIEDAMRSDEDKDDLEEPFIELAIGSVGAPESMIEFDIRDMPVMSQADPPEPMSQRQIEEGTVVTSTEGVPMAKPDVVCPQSVGDRMERVGWLILLEGDEPIELFTHKRENVKDSTQRQSTETTSGPLPNSPTSAKFMKRSAEGDDSASARNEDQPEFHFSQPSSSGEHHTVQIADDTKESPEIAWSNYKYKARKFSREIYV